MFLKKHSQLEWTPADRQRERLLLDYFAAETNLEEKAKVAIVRKGSLTSTRTAPTKIAPSRTLRRRSTLCSVQSVRWMGCEMT